MDERIHDVSLDSQTELKVQKCKTLKFHFCRKRNFNQELNEHWRFDDDTSKYHTL